MSLDREYDLVVEEAVFQAAERAPSWANTVTPAPSHIPGAISVATYNIHRCIGLDRIRDPARIANVIGELGADVIGLQEVDARGRRFQNMLARRLGAPAERRAANAVDQFEYLAQKIGGQAVRGPPMRPRSPPSRRASRSSRPTASGRAASPSSPTCTCIARRSRAAHRIISRFKPRSACHRPSRRCDMGG